MVSPTLVGLVLGRIRAPKVVHVLIPEMCGSVTFHSEICRWTDFPAFSGCAHCDRKGPYKRETGGPEGENIKTEAEVRQERSCYGAWL